MPKRKKHLEEDPNDEYHFSIPLADFLAGPSGGQINAEVPTVVERTSADGRRVYTETINVAPPSPVKRAREEQAAREPLVPMDPADDPALPTIDIDFDLDSDRYHMDLGGIYDRPPSPVRKSQTKSKFKPSVRVVSLAGLHRF